MAETLGDAVLSLRTDDAQFNSGITQARGRAEQLGGVLDKTSGSSSRLAAEMVQTGQSAKTMGAGFEESSRRVTASAGAQRAGMQQLSFQLNDIATMYSLGARPMQIFASQSGQVVQAVQMMTGGTSRLAAFLGGPWGIAVTSAAIVLTPFIAKLFQAEDALQAVEFASDNLGDAQDILRSVIDTTTGSIDRQRTALLLLAQAKALAAVQESRQQVSGLRGDLEGAAGETQVVRGPLGIPLIGGAGPGGLRLARRATDSANIVRGVLDGSLSSQDAVRQLGQLRERGGITASEEVQLAATIANLGVASGNQNRNEALLRFLNDEATPADRELLGVGDLIDRPSGGGGGGGGRSGRTGRSGRAGRDQGEIDARYDAELVQITRQILSARLQIATSAEERAEIQRRLVEWDRRTALAGIEADEELSRIQKDELAAATTRLADAELEAIEFARRAETERDAAMLAEERFGANREALDLQLQLADTEAERKAIALRLLDAEEEFLRARLTAITVSETATDAERQRAAIALNALRNTSADRREAVSRANETSVERYLRDLQQGPAQISEAVDRIALDGLDRFNDGLVDAIMGARSLGDVFSSVADQIIADLLRIAIQQAIIKPLAESLFGGGGGGGGGFNLGSIFAGFFADGGLIPSGQFGIVGEAGPELAFAGPGGVNIVSNAESRQMLSADSGAGGSGGGTTISMPINIDATGADAAAIARLNSQLAKMERDLPERIVTTIQEAGDRRIFSTGDWR